MLWVWGDLFGSRKMTRRESAAASEFALMSFKEWS